MARAPSVGAAVSQGAPSSVERRRVARLFQRAGFGATVGEIDQWAALGYEAAVEHLVGFPPAASRADDAEVTAVTAQARALDTSFGSQHLIQLSLVQRWWLDRMATTQYPLEEKLTLYWHGHFTSAYSKVIQLGVMMTQNQLLRDLAGGDFRDLCKRITGDATMLIYLDGSSNQLHAPNENYAREFMELFTLGRNQGYSQADVRDAARAFTGYTVDRVGNVSFDPARHDAGPKTILGNTGEWGPLDVTDLVLDRHPGGRVAAGYVAQRFAAFFHQPRPEPPLVAALAAQFAASNYEIRALARALFARSEFMDGPLRTMKSPAELAAGVIRALGLARGGGQPGEVPSFMAGGNNDAFALACDEMGQVLFDPPNVSGWHGGAAWANTATTLARYNFARLAATLVTADSVAAVLNQTGGKPQAVTTAWMDRLGLLELSAATSAALAQYAAAASAAKETPEVAARGLLTLLIASPDYNLR